MLGWMVHMKRRTGLIVIFIYFIIQACSLPFVGMTWDEPSSFFFGRTALHFYLTGNRAYVTDANYADPKLFGNDPFGYIFGEDVYPPFPFVIASITSAIFAETLHIMSPLTAHHLGLLFLGIIGVLAMYGIGLTLRWSTTISLGIALLYGTYPTIVAQMRNDAKDAPLMSMIVLFVYMAINWLFSMKQGGKRNFLWGIGTGVGLGLALASKPTAAIIVPIFSVWFVFSYAIFRSFRNKIGSIPKLIIPALFIGVVSLAIFFISWPWLWDDPFGKITAVWNFFKVVGRGMPTLYLGTVYQAGFNLPWHYPFVIFGVQTPITVLGIGLIALIAPLWIVFKKRDPIPLLFLFWIIIGMGRFFVPGVLIYAKVRHFIDVLPAFFILIGVLLNEVVSSKHQVVSEKKTPRFKFLPTNYFLLTTKLCLCIMLLEQVWVIGTHFPYEPSYFNAFIGGTKTVAEKKLFDIEYWASGVKDAMKYIERVTQSDQPATVYACTMAHLALFYESPHVKVTSNPAGATYTLVPNSASWFGGAEAFMRQNNDLVYTVRRNGGDLFYVFKHKSYSGWNCGQETNMVYKR